MRAWTAVLMLALAGVAHGSHCPGSNSWAMSGGGSYVGNYNDPKWSACVGAGSGRHETFESWVGAQYACEGTYPKPTGGSAFLRIYRCVKASGASGYCVWADSPPGSPSGHEDSVNASHTCINCNAGFHWTGESACVLGNGDGCNYGEPDCERCGNPIHGATGNKYQRETDYTGRGPFPLTFERSYNSFIGYSRGSLGAGWRSNYDRALKVRPYGSFGSPPYQWVVGEVRITATRADGRELTFTSTVDDSTQYKLPDGSFLSAPPYAKERLEKVAGGFRLYTADDEVEAYTAGGKLQSVTDRHGRTQLLSYDGNGRLSRVQDPFGRQVTLAYGTQGRLSQMADPAGGIYHYAYDASGRLATVTHPDATTRTYLYESPDIPHLLTGIIDENGDRFATWGYGSLGRAVLSEHAGGAGRVSLGYNADGTTTETNALGRARRLSFANIAGLMRLAGTSVTCPGCSAMGDALTYDANGNIASRTDFNGNTTLYVHDARGLERSRTQAHGSAEQRTIATEWHEALRLPVRIEEPGRTTTHTYDAAGNRLSRSVTDTAGGGARTIAWTHDDRGQVLTVDGPRTDVRDVTTYTYHECTTGAACGQVRTMTDALGQVTTHSSYDAHGNPLTIVDPNGVATTITYDARQRPTSRTAAGATTRYAYDGVGQLVRVTLPDGSYLDYEYDAAHRLVGIADTLGNRVRYALDAMGNRTGEQVFDAAGALKRARSWAFDALGRVQAIRNAAGEVVTAYGYDANGNRTRQVEYSTPGTGHATTFVHDALDRVVQVTDAGGGITRYGYDARDGRVSVTDPLGLVTRYVLNALGDLSRQASPDTGTTTYTHDAAGNRRSQTDARGVTAGYSHDALNRLTRIDLPDRHIAYTYDDAGQPYGRGRLTAIADPGGTTALTYDARGNVVEERRVIADKAYVTRYDYDEADRIVRIVYPSGRAVEHVRDLSGQVTRVTAAGGSIASDIRHLPFGPASGLALGNGVLVTRAFDQDYRLVEYRDGSIQHLRLYYDLRGNVEATENLLDPARSQSFGYDALSRLTAAEGSYGLQAYSYDGVGNRLTLSASTYRYASDRHHLLEVSDGTSFSYDEAGNVAAKGGLTLAHDAAGRLQAASRGSRRLGQYVYNAAGQRVIKVAGEPGPDYLAMAEEAERQAQGLRIEAQRLESLAAQYDEQAGVLLGDAVRLEGQAAELQAQADQARAEAAAYFEEARPYLEKAYEWQRRAEESRETAESATGMRREALLAKAEREDAKADGYLAKAEPYLEQQRQALARAAQLDQEAGMLLAQAQDARAEALRLTGLAVAARADAQQQLTQAGQLEAQAAEYRRIAQEQEQNPPQYTRHFVHDRAGALLGEYDDSGSPVREYVWLESLPLAMFTDAATTAYAIHSDHLDTPQKLTDAGGQIVWDASYEPFGKAALLVAAVEQPLRFPGQYFDAETGLHQNWFRDYDPAIGRYLQSDPIGLVGGITTYAYAAGNPVRYTDPTGLATCGSGGNEPFVPDNPFGFKFSPCCQRHDDCYGTCGNAKFQCDSDFLACMGQACNSATSAFTYSACRQLAELYYAAVVNHGQTAYNNAQKGACKMASCEKGN